MVALSNQTDVVRSFTWIKSAQMTLTQFARVARNVCCLNVAKKWMISHPPRHHPPQLPPGMIRAKCPCERSGPFSKKTVLGDSPDVISRCVVGSLFGFLVRLLRFQGHLSFSLDVTLAHGLIILAVDW